MRRAMPHCFLLLAVYMFSGVTAGGQQAPCAASPTVKVIKAVPAIYPQIAGLAAESGTVTVEVQINPKGEVSKATVISGHELFAKAAERSAYRWVFNSISEKGAVRSVQLTFEFLFVRKPVSPDDLLPVFLPPYKIEIRGGMPSFTNTPSVRPPH